MVVAVMTPWLAQGGGLMAGVAWQAGIRLTGQQTTSTTCVDATRRLQGAVSHGGALPYAAQATPTMHQGESEHT